MILDTFPAAPADTLLGRLQRGTGAGHLQALAADRDIARSTLKSSIRLDWRWDRQLDSRSWYYACLAETFGITSGEIEELILSTVDHDPRDAADEVAVRVLGQMASWGDDSAADRLIDYVRYGRDPSIPVAWCTERHDAGDLDRLHRALQARFPNKAAMARDTANLSDLVCWLESLAERDGRFRRFIQLIVSVQESRTAKATEPPPKELSSSASTFEEGCQTYLLAARPDWLGPADSTRWRRDSLAWLGERGFPAHAGWLTEFLFADHPEPTTARLADLATLLPVEEWPAVTRRALADGRTGPRWAAGKLLERSERPDGELVRLCLNAALGANDMYPVCTMLDIVERARLVDLVPDVEAAYREATYSWGARLRAVETLERLAPGLFREQYARECLWDCEEFIIEIGCRHVDLDDLDVRPRLEFLRDAFEDDHPADSRSLHRTARERLGY